jgi:hypothetical protein
MSRAAAETHEILRAEDINTNFSIFEGSRQPSLWKCLDPSALPYPSLE